MSIHPCSNISERTHAIVSLFDALVNSYEPFEFISPTLHELELHSPSFRTADGQIVNLIRCFSGREKMSLSAIDKPIVRSGYGIGLQDINLSKKFVEEIDREGELVVEFPETLYEGLDSDPDSSETNSIDTEEESQLRDCNFEG